MHVAASVLASLPSIYNFVPSADLSSWSSTLVDADGGDAAADSAAATPPRRLSNALTFVAHTPNLYTSLPADPSPALPTPHLALPTLAFKGDRVHGRV
eukprot:1252746-Pleurochrysis_carterae.AAC.1